MAELPQMKVFVLLMSAPCTTALPSALFRMDSAFFHFSEDLFQKKFFFPSAVGQAYPELARGLLYDFIGAANLPREMIEGKKG
ncbi:MAG: hypothetical protein KH420_09300 [Clostridiales bacterium]|nr:hypothetical protein [Clostridiales bacterium]